MTSKKLTVLEIGSGSFKLFKDGEFSERFQSSLGKGLGPNGELDPESLAVAMESLDDGIIPFLKERGISNSDALVFATAAVRRSMKDPAKSGDKFLADLRERGFRDIRVFSEDDESRYAGLAVIENISSNNSNPEDYAILDTGGASHQLIEVKAHEIQKTISIPIGSHQDLSSCTLPNFIQMGFNRSTTLVTIGTSGKILGSAPSTSLGALMKIRDDLMPLSIEKRREYLCDLIKDEDIHRLFVDFRLEILPNAFTLIINCAQNLGVKSFLSSPLEAKGFVSKHGFVD